MKFKDEELNSKINEIMGKISLKTRFSVSIEMEFITLLTDLGYREEKMWTDDEDDKLQTICDSSKKLAEHLIKEMEKWENDGKPTDDD